MCAWHIAPLICILDILCRSQFQLFFAIIMTKVFLFSFRKEKKLFIVIVLLLLRYITFPQYFLYIKECHLVLHWLNQAKGSTFTFFSNIYWMYSRDLNYLLCGCSV